MSYQAIVATLENVQPHPNADRLQIATVLNGSHNIVVGLENKTGDVGVYFATDGKLSEEYCIQNELFPIYDQSGAKIGGGMFDPKNRRVRAQNLRSVKSDGYFASLDSVAFTGVNLADLYVGFQFDVLNDVLICEKYYTPQTLRAMKGGTAATRRVVPMLPMHQDTKQFAYEAETIAVGSICTTTLKIHGTCLVGETPIAMADGSQKKIRDIVIGDEVLGLNADLDIVPTKVTDTIIQPAVDTWIDTRIAPSGKKCDGRGLVLRSTPEHLIFTKDKGYVEATSLAENDIVYLEQEYILPSDDQWSILIGVMLGDGTLSDNSDYAAGVSVGHSEDQADYLNYTLRSLGNYGGSGNLKSRTSGFGSQMYDMTTKYSAFVGDKFASFYEPYEASGRKRKKVVPPWIADEMNAITCAFWYMDDGSLSHTEYQNDRANFATCDFSYDDCMTLVKGLNNLGITNVTVYGKDKDVNVHPRIRINSKGPGGADDFFKMIQPYIPVSMQYKLPEKYRNENWEEPVFADGSVAPYLRESFVTATNISPPPSFTRPGRESQRRRFDITTETHNFFANHICVHNSHRLANALVDVEHPQKWHHKILRKTPRITQEWKIVHGTRRVILGEHDERMSFYGTDKFRYDATAFLEPNLKKGEVIYGEIVGYVNDTTLVMGEVSTKDLKKDREFKSFFGGTIPETMKYTYNCLPGQADFYVYRIAMADEEGNLVELSWPQVKKRCRELGAKFCPDFGLLPYTVSKKEGIAELEEIVENFNSGADPIDPSHIREGVVVRVDQPDGSVRFLKSKNYFFKVLESIIKANEDYIDTEEVS